VLLNDSAIQSNHQKCCFLKGNGHNLTKIEIKLVYIIKLSQEIKKVEFSEVAVFNHINSLGVPYEQKSIN
jgi:hypothetical protein